MGNKPSVFLFVMFLFALDSSLFALQSEASTRRGIELQAVAGMDTTSSRSTSATFGSSVSVALPVGFRVRAVMDHNVAYDIRFFLADLEYVPFTPVSLRFGTSRLLYNTLNAGDDSVEAALALTSLNGFCLAVGFSYTSLSFDGVSTIYSFGSSSSLIGVAYFQPTVFCSLPLLRTAAVSCDIAAYSKNVLFAPTESLLNARLSFRAKLSRSFSLSAAASSGFRGLSGLSFGLESIRLEVGLGREW
ncbi:MAG: hypothetical protein WCT14_10450 [Treponemataceae bacterium]